MSDSETTETSPKSSNFAAWHGDVTPDVMTSLGDVSTRMHALRSTFVSSSNDVVRQTTYVIDHVTEDGVAQTTFPTEQTILSTAESIQFYHPMWATVLIVIACTVIMVGTVVGNLLVCTAVSIVRKLRTPSNWLIVSLAVADLLVALLVMPLAAMYEVKGQWVLGQTMCDLWTSLDVMLCTASILNLCMISVDRYFLISQPFSYGAKRTPVKMMAMILSAWILAAIITIPPIFGWKGKIVENQCELSQEIGYQIYATIGAFYLPLIVMIIIYYRIYTLSNRLHRSEVRSKPSVDNAALHRKQSVPSTGSKSSMDNSHSGNRLDVGGGSGSGDGRQLLGEGFGSRQSSVDAASSKMKRSMSFLHRSGSHRASVSRERKATKTLGVIMGAFTACWLPFFILALIRPFLPDPSVVPPVLVSLLQWLGFANSFLNPIIYARFNRDFRTPFKEILSFRCFGINTRLRSESYTEQYGLGSDGGLPGGHRGTVVHRHPVSRGGSVLENSVFASDGTEREYRTKYLNKNGAYTKRESAS